MQMDAQVMDALELLERERGVPAEAILDALANALVSAYKRSPGAAEEARVTIDPDSGDIIVYAQELDEDGNVISEWEDTPDDFGRIAAQTAKQVMMQRIREAERELKYEEYAGREGDIVTGIIQQTDSRYTLLDLGRVEALLPQAEQVPYERPAPNTRLKAYIVEVRRTAKVPHRRTVGVLPERHLPEEGAGVEVDGVERPPGRLDRRRQLPHRYTPHPTHRACPERLHRHWEYPQ